MRLGWKTRRAFVVCVVTVLAVGALGVVSAAAADTSGATSSVAADQQKLVDQAKSLCAAAKSKNQTAFTLYGASLASWGPVFEAFKAQFPGLAPTPVVQPVATTSAKLAQEFASGQHIADLYMTGSPGLAEQISAGHLEKNDFFAAPLNTVTIEKAGDGYWTPASGTGFGIAYNTNEISKPPTSVKDLAKKQFKDKLVMAPLNAVSSAQAFFEYQLEYKTVTQQFVQDLLQKQGAQVVPTTGQIAQPLATGERPLAIYPLSFGLADAAKGAPVDVVFPLKQPNFVSAQGPVLLKNAPSPDAAKCFMTWVYTPAGQRAIAKIGDYPLVEGQPGPGGRPSIDKVPLFKNFGDQQAAMDAKWLPIMTALSKQ